MTAESELDYSSAALPGGSLFASVYDRAFMQLSDRGGASNAVGDRWAELCAESLEDSHEAARILRIGDPGVVAEATVRLDDIPEIARTASRNKLQNPDFLMIGQVDGNRVLWAADAKFSVDTARSKQVSGEVVTALLGLGDTVRRLLPNLEDDVAIRNGVFLCPDYVLTHRLLRDRRGPRRATVKLAEVRFVPVTAPQFLDPVGQAGIRDFFATLDDLPIDPDVSLMLGLYYFRLARAALGCWLDQTAPLLSYRDKVEVDEAAIEAEAKALATMRTSAWGLVQRWNDVADEVRQQRSAIDHVTSLPINSRVLREQIELVASRAGVVPPSSTRVRKSVGSWFRGKLREEFGPINPPVENFGDVLDRLGRYSRSLQPEISVVTSTVIDELVSQSSPVPS